MIELCSSLKANASSGKGASRGNDALSDMADAPALNRSSLPLMKKYSAIITFPNLILEASAKGNKTYRSSIICRCTSLMNIIWATSVNIAAMSIVLLVFVFVILMVVVPIV